MNLSRRVFDITSCPGGNMREKIRGYRVFAGGKFGRRPSLGKRILGVLRTKEEAGSSSWKSSS
jgi:hypothetical protein